MPSQRTVLITGCSDGGLGSYLALAFHQAGWRVFASGRNLSKLSKATAAGIETVQLDTLSDDSIAGAVAAVKKSTGGHLDALVNNAGAAHSMPLMDLDISKARELFDLNVFSLISVTRAFLPLLLNSSYERGALVVNNTSIASQTRGALPFEGAYSASKAAAGSLTEVMRLELQPFGIRVINLVTGGVRTNLFSNAPSVELPPESLFNVAKEAVEKAMWAGSGANMDRFAEPTAWAKHTVKDLSKANPPWQIWRGTFAIIIRLLSCLPVGVLDGPLKRATNLYVVEHNVREMGGPKKLELAMSAKMREQTVST